MTGLLLACGNLGAIMATNPLAWMANILGWRSRFFIIGGVTFGLAPSWTMWVKWMEFIHPRLTRTPSWCASLSLPAA